MVCCINQSALAIQRYFISVQCGITERPVADRLVTACLLANILAHIDAKMLTSDLNEVIFAIA